MGNPARGIPEDFADLCQIHGSAWLIDHYVSSHSTVTRWARALGVSIMSNKRPIPEGFAEDARTTALWSLTKIYGCGYRSASRWLKELGMEPCTTFVQHPFKPVPNDFAASAHLPTLTLARVFSADCRTIKRWRGIIGIEMAPKREKVAPVASYRAPLRSVSKKQPIGSTRPDGLCDRAADYLKQWFRPVYNQRRLDKFKADKWWCGNNLLTPDELIAKAEAKGFQAREWAMVA